MRFNGDGMVWWILGLEKYVEMIFLAQLKNEMANFENTQVLFN